MHLFDNAIQKFTPEQKLLWEKMQEASEEYTKARDKYQAAEKALADSLCPFKEGDEVEIYVQHDKPWARAKVERVRPKSYGPGYSIIVRRFKKDGTLFSSEHEVYRAIRAITC